MTPEQQDAHDLAREFIDYGLASQNSYFPDDEYGRKAQQYYEWSQRAFRLLQRIGKIEGE